MIMTVNLKVLHLRKAKSQLKRLVIKKGVICCGLCNYKCKKEMTLKKHMVTNHDNHTCKEWFENLPTFIVLLKHVAKHHDND